MGLIKTEKFANGNIGLEITYGGREAPFGGIDSSMPPQYIDPLCAVDVQGFIIVNGQYVAVSFEPLAITINLPSSDFTNPSLAGFGSFYTAAQGWQNFVVIKGDTFTDSNNNAGAFVALYVWPSSNTATPASDVLSFTQALITNPATSATQQVLTDDVGTTTSGGCGYTLTSADGLTTENYNIPSTTSRNAAITSLVNQINALPSVICTAVVNADTVSATLTTIATGTSANNVKGSGFFIQPLPPGGFKGVYVYSNNGFQGGANSYTYPAGEVPYPISWVQVGESLYIGGPGTVILQYSNQIFSILSQYVGANVLKKFAGSLLALGITPSPGTIIQNAEMVLAWSAAGNFSTWNPTDSSGNVTGAGFEQLADIGDPLTGGFVNNSTLVILRAQGVSYATATGNASLPFDVSHIDLASEGEGCQGVLLSSQYGPLGFYVGNSDVYEFVQNGKPVGQKISTLLFPLLSPQGGSGSSSLGASKVLAPFYLDTEVVLYSVFAGQGSATAFLFVYNPSNNTWTRIPFKNTFLTNVNSLYLDDFPLLNTAGSQYTKQSQLVLGSGASSTKTFNFYSLQETLPDVNSPGEVNYSFITFPAEEISHGRDITIDGLYITCAGKPNQYVYFSLINPSTGTVVGTGVLQLPAAASYTNLAEYQVYFSATGVGASISAVSLKCPQLLVQLPTGFVAGSINPFRIAKISMFGSFDPAQRPV